MAVLRGLLLGLGLLALCLRIVCLLCPLLLLLLLPLPLLLPLCLLLLRLLLLPVAVPRLAPQCRHPHPKGLQPTGSAPDQHQLAAEKYSDAKAAVHAPPPEQPS